MWVGAETKLCDEISLQTVSNERDGMQSNVTPLKDQKWIWLFDQNKNKNKKPPKDSVFDARQQRLAERRAHSVWVTSPAPRPPPHRQAGWLFNCVTFIDESAQCCWDRGGAPSRAERWNAPIEENTDGQPRSAARRPVPRHWMPV